MKPHGQKGTLSRQVGKSSELDDDEEIDEYTYEKPIEIDYEDCFKVEKRWIKLELLKNKS